jgi:hypothetical protein
MALCLSQVYINMSKYGFCVSMIQNVYLLYCDMKVGHLLLKITLIRNKSVMMEVDMVYIHFFQEALT